MKSAVLLWLSLSCLITAMKWAASGYRKATFAIALFTIFIAWYAADRIADVSELRIRSYLNDDINRTSILALLTIESSVVPVVLWKSMKDDAGHKIRILADLLLTLPALCCVPTLLLVEHDVFSRWNAIDFELAAIITGVLIALGMWFSSLIIRGIPVLKPHRTELAAMSNLLFLPWSAVAFVLLNREKSGFGTSGVVIDLKSGPAWIWFLVLGLPFMGFLGRTLIHRFQERGLA